jgi:hypothetical protein
MLSKSGERGYSCLFLNLLFQFSPFSMMLTIGLSNIAFIMLSTFLLFLIS